MMACPWVTRSSHVCRMKRVWLLCVSNGVTPGKGGGVGVGFEVFGLRLCAATPLRHKPIY